MEEAVATEVPPWAQVPPPRRPPNPLLVTGRWRMLLRQRFLLGLLCLRAPCRLRIRVRLKLLQQHHQRVLAEIVQRLVEGEIRSSLHLERGDGVASAGVTSESQSARTSG